MHVACSLALTHTSTAAFSVGLSVSLLQRPGEGRSEMHRERRAEVSGAFPAMQHALRSVACAACCNRRFDQSRPRLPSLRAKRPRWPAARSSSQDHTTDQLCRSLTLFLAGCSLLLCFRRGVHATQPGSAGRRCCGPADAVSSPRCLLLHLVRPRSHYSIAPFHCSTSKKAKKSESKQLGGWLVCSLFLSAATGAASLIVFEPAAAQTAL